ncbi:MAG: hypothetical protein AAF747_06395 [Planctomycetota bacterium]
MLQSTLSRASAAGPDVDVEGDQGREKCGVVAVWGHPRNVELTYLGLYAQQHRGQEAAGLAITNGAQIEGHVGMGLVPEVLTEQAMTRLRGYGPRACIGHNRYSTAGGSLACNAQPLIESYHGGRVALAHNGNLINGHPLRKVYERRGHIFHTTSDTEAIIHVFASPEQQNELDPVAATLRRLQGAFSLMMMFPDRIEIARDPWGWRPLVLGWITEDGCRYPVAASETVALDVMGATFDREVEPGEVVTFSNDGVKSRRFAAPAPRLALCAFEHVYFASPASNVFGENVQMVRERLGEQLSREAAVEADYVMPMPDSGRSAVKFEKREHIYKQQPIRETLRLSVDKRSGVNTLCTKGFKEI